MQNFLVNATTNSSFIMNSSFKKNVNKDITNLRIEIHTQTRKYLKHSGDKIGNVIEICGKNFFFDPIVELI